jgi:DNA-binding CsgD family transcriptional regulator
MKMYEFNFERLDNINYHAFSLKFPWYGNNNQIVGIFICGISIVENNFSELIKFLTQIKDMNLLSSNNHSFFHQTMISSNIIDGVYIPKREMECLMYLTQGNTAKMTAQKLKISPRTVEYYIDNIKIKLNVHSKNELLNKVREFYTK